MTTDKAEESTLRAPPDSPVDRERRLDSENENIPTMVGYWDRNLNNRFGNRAYAEWFGFDPEKLPGMHMRDVIGEERYRINLPYIEAALRGQEQQFERTIQTVDGKLSWYGLVQYLPDFAAGQVQGCYIMVSDISALKRAEAALREKDEKLRGLYDLAPLGIAMSDMNGHFVDFNEAFRNICGYSTQELKALDYWALTPPRYAAQEAARLEEIQRTGHFGPYEKEYLRKDGCLIPISLNGVMITGSDGQRYIWVVAEDLTKRKHAEQLKLVLDDYHELSLGAMEHKRERIVGALTTLSLYRDNETGRHIKRTQLYVQALAQELVRTGCNIDQLSEGQIDVIVKAAPMHDLGKVGIPDIILLKPGRHTPQETAVMQTHAAIGETILGSTASAGDASDSLLLVASRIAAAHHENWDGSGYPRGQKGQDIALEARLMALADVYDALTTERVYKRAWTHEAASAEILTLAGIKFDPDIVRAFQGIQAKFRSISEEFRDTQVAEHLGE